MLSAGDEPGARRLPPCVRVVVHPCAFVSIFQVGGWDDGVAYSAERKAAVLKKMLPPNNVPLRRLSQMRGYPRRPCTAGGRRPVTRASCFPTPMRAPKAGVRVTSSQP